MRGISVRYLTPAADKAERALQNLKVFNLSCIRNQGLEKWKAKAKSAKNKYFSGKLVYGKGPVEYVRIWEECR
jgi:hypothetical protein